MCFSASASFGAGIVLSTIGIASIKRAEKSSEKFFASIPLIFAIQQISEGFLWLALSDPDFALLRWPMTYTFIFFAQMVWPFWVPFSVLMLEKEQRRKRTEIALMIIGGIVSLYLAYCLLSFPIEAKIIGRHISYEQDYPKGVSKYGGLLYIIATIVPPFFSGIRKMWMLGAAILVSYIISAIFYTDYIVSVWCFFASVISIAVFAILYEKRKSPVRFVPSERNKNNAFYS